MYKDEKINIVGIYRWYKNRQDENFAGLDDSPDRSSVSLV